MEEKPREWYEKQCLTIDVLHEGFFSLMSTVNLDKISFSYSTDDGETWLGLMPYKTIKVRNGQKIMVNGIVGEGLSGTVGRLNCQFPCNVYGNVLSLTFGLNFLGQKLCPDIKMSGLFKYADVIDASNLILPSENLSVSCFTAMFKKCLSLRKAPKLLAMELSPRCYEDMFMGCTSLMEAPQLPATKLANNCYLYMFYGCGRLKKAPLLPAMELEWGCYQCMFAECYGLEEAPKLPAMKLAEFCYAYMFENCKNLKESPQLVAAQLYESSYKSMFNGCAKLRKANRINARVFAKNSLSYMFDGCVSLTEVQSRFTSVKGLGVSGNWSMFGECINLSHGPIFIDGEKL